jgi:uncharacterized protein (TIGR02231 family)
MHRRSDLGAIIFSILISVFVFTPLSLHAAEYKTDSKLTQATVYTNRAMLKRTADLDIPAGAHEIVFSGLPSNLLPDSIRIEGQAASPVIFGAITHKLVIETALTVPREKELTDQLQILSEQVKIMEAEKIALAIKKEFLKNLGEHASSRFNEEIVDFNLKPEQWENAAQTLFSSVDQILKANIALDHKIRETNEKITKIKRELDMQATGQRAAYQVRIPVDLERDARVSLSLFYQVPNASWRPVYDARLDTEKAELIITQFGAVRQTTGEDWNDISLVLSTAQPHRGASLPPLRSMWVDFMSHRPPVAYMQKGMGGMAPGAPAARSMAFAEADVISLEAEERMMPAEFIAAEINTGGFVSEYIIPGRNDVVSDGSESKVLIGQFDTQSKLQVQIKPQLSTNAILTAVSRLEGDNPILPGQVSLFRDGAYVGQSNLPLLKPGEENELNFGIDDNITVERHVMKDQRGEAGVIGKTTNVERHFETIIKNAHNQNIEVAVFETIPVSKNKDIEVEIVDKHTTAGFKQDAANVKGQLMWLKNLSPKSDEKIKLGWRVSWPEDKSISGL